MKIITLILGFLAVAPAFAEAGKYPECLKGRTLKSGDKFHLDYAFKDSVNGDLAVVLYQMGANTVLRPAFPKMITTGMSIEFELVKRPNPLNATEDPKELERTGLREIEGITKLPHTTIFCN